MRFRISLVLLPVILVSILAFTACSSDDTSDPTDESNGQAASAPNPTTMPVPTATAILASTATAVPLPTYPLTVTDMMGRTVSIETRPQSIVSLSPTATELLYAIGGTAVGRDSSSKYPPEVLGLPEVGGAYSPSVEAIVALQPDLILIEVVTQSWMVDMLQAVNFPIVTVRAASLEDVTESLELLGQVIDEDQGADAAIESILSRIKAAKVDLAEVPKVLILISDADRNIYAAKPESFPGAVAAQHGLINLAEGLPDSGPWAGFTLLSPEQALVDEPDIIFTISPAPPPVPPLSTMLPLVPGFGSLPAVQEGRVREVDPTIFLSAQGPRIADAVEEMSQILKEVFP